MENKTYAQMTKEETTQLCEERGIDPTLPRKDIFAALKEWDEKGLRVEGEDGIEELEVDDSKDWQKVIFHSTREDDLGYLYVGLNGKGYYIKKEEEITVPKILLDGPIKDAVEIHEEPYKGMDGKIHYRIKKVHRFPYTIVND